jgi:hypothetical protein
LFRTLDTITISLDQTRRDQYPGEMGALEGRLPELAERCWEHRVTLTCNYTARWDELEHPERIEAALESLLPYFASTYVMPVREAGKTPSASAHMP